MGSLVVTTDQGRGLEGYGNTAADCEVTYFVQLASAPTRDAGAAHPPAVGTNALVTPCSSGADP